MARETLNDLLLDELKDTFDAENQITEALPKMIKAASSTELKEAFQKHLKQTEGHLARLEEVFKLLGKKAERKTCKAMKGLIAEGEDMIKDHKPSPLLDAGLIGSAQRVEHYEMAAYGTSRAYAEALGESKVAKLLQQTLDEEKATDELLTELGEPINRQCAEVSEHAK
ncbi:MAG TPA: ferritin-like domain-containing protein [Phototrophicaceae bacterium]|jgi:ferritin-like metal-binding protein YciE|nr:ferritin-like domain-containing protein [Phototrophicaceae bacterium]